MARRPLGELPPDLARVGAGVSRVWAPVDTPVRPPTASHRDGGSARFIPWSFKTVAGSKLFLPVRPRGYLLVQNNFGSDLRMNLDLDASNTVGLRIPAGNAFEWNVRVPANALYFWAATAGGSFDVFEG